MNIFYHCNNHGFLLSPFITNPNLPHHHNKQDTLFYKQSPKWGGLTLILLFAPFDNILL
jgi:hypothetical protein